MKQTNFLKSFFLLFALIVGSSSVWGATNFSETYSYGGNTWTRTNFTDESTYYKSLSDKDCVASIAGIFTGKTITSDVVITLDIACYGNGSNPTASKFSIYTSSACTTSVTATQSGTLPNSSSYTSAVYTISKENALAKFTDDLAIKVASGTKLIRFRSFRVQFSYTPAAPAYAITAQSNNNSYGTVSLSGSVITGSPNSGYRYADPAYTVKTGTATVSQEGNAFTVTPSTDCTVQINFEAIPTYTVTFNAEGGTCGTPSATETIGGAGVTLPAATTGVAGWEFAGWAADATASTTTRPTLYKSGSTYYPTANVNLYAVYTLEDSFNKFAMATSNSDIVDGANVVISSLGTNKYTLANNSGTLTGIANFTPTDGIITCSNTQAIWTLDISDGKVTIANGGKYLKRSSTTVSADEASSNWTIIKSNLVDNRFLIKDATTNYYLEHNGTSWIPYNTTSITQSNTTNYIGLTIYVEMANKYDSNPTQAVVTPVVEFNSTDAKTLYLDGTKTYTNAATVTGIDKPISYSSSDESVATVNASGVVTAEGIGTATITASVAAELGVNKAASKTYEITVKNTTTIAGLKALYNAAQSPAKAFAADLTDAVVTYVSGNHAYIQDASGAIYASCGSSLTAGKKINGAVSGTITAPNKIDEIETIDISAATVTEDGVIPAAAVKTLAEIKAGDYDGKLVTVNGATVKTGMNNATSGGVITDDGNVTTFNIIAPNKLTLNATEEGNFTAFVSIYGGSTYRLNIYEASQFVKTRNVATVQTLTFDEDDVNLDEDTEALANYVGQAVNGAHTTLTWEVDGASDDIVQSIDAATGALVLNGACGAAIIKVTAAAEEVEEAEVITPYLAANASYMITVNPRYMVTFSVNGVETVLRQATSSTSIAVPTPSDFGDYKFMGWSTSTVDPTDDAPSMTDLGATVIPTDNDDKYYAVYAQERAGGEENRTSEFVIKTSSTPSNPIVIDGVSWTYSGVDFANSANACMPENSTVTFALPNDALNAVSVEITSTSNIWAGSAKLSLPLTDKDDNVLTTLYKDNNSYDFTSTDNNVGPYTITSTTTDSKKAYIDHITVTYAIIGTENYDYRTSLPNVEVTIPESKFLSFCYGSKLDFSESDVKAYKASVDGKGKVTLTKVDVVPAGEGVVLYCETPNTYSIPVTTKDASDVTGNQMVGVLVRTQVVWNPEANVYNYILQQGQFNKATDGYLKPNRAYLSTSYDVTPLGAKALSVVFAEDETDGIRSIENSELRIENSNYYNLAGQKVDADYKGIVIVNGKKYIRK